MNDITIKDAREHYFRRNGLPLDGGYNDKWVPLKAWFITVYLYNSKARKAAVRLHDIHHIVTGYQSDLVGEAEISAWEYAAGIYDKHFARFINLTAIFYGVILFPKRTFRAYLLGKASQSLYNETFSEALLQESVASVQQRLLPTTISTSTLATSKAKPKANLSSLVEFAGLFLLSCSLCLLPLALALFGWALIT